MLLVELSSHPNGGACPLVGVFAVISFSFQSADAVMVVVRNAAGDFLASLPPNSVFTTPHLCSAMPVLYRFYPINAEAEFGPPWNYNV